MKNLKEPYGLFEKSTGASHSEEEGLIAPASNISSIYCFAYSYFYGL